MRSRYVYASYACMALVIDIFYTTSMTWYTSSRCVMLFYVPALVYVVLSAVIRVCGAILCPGTLVYVVVSAYGSRHDCGVCAVRLFNISAA